MNCSICEYSFSVSIGEGGLLPPSYTSLPDSSFEEASDHILRKSGRKEWSVASCRVLNPANNQEILEEGPSPVEPSDALQPG